MADWKPSQYYIDQGNDPKAAVDGCVSDGLGVHRRRDLCDVWTVTHIGSGLRVADIDAESFEEAVIYANEIASSADWIALVKAEPDNRAHRDLAQRICQIQLTARRDYEERIRLRAAGVLFEEDISP